MGPPADLWMPMTPKGDGSDIRVALGSEEFGKKWGSGWGELPGTWLYGNVTGGGRGGRGVWTPD